MGIIVFLGKGMFKASISVHLESIDTCKKVWAHPGVHGCVTCSGSLYTIFFSTTE